VIIFHFWHPYSSSTQHVTTSTPQSQIQISYQSRSHHRLLSDNMAKIEVDFKPAPDSIPKMKIRRSPSTNSSPMQFSWYNQSSRLVLTSDSPDFDPITISRWKEEGFAVAYLLYDGDTKSYLDSLRHLADPLELGETYAIVGIAVSLQRPKTSR
jgi:hypothetical protein